MSVQHIAVLGCTGSIGCNTLDVVARHADRYRVYALAAGSNVDQMVQQIAAHQPVFAVMADLNAAQQVERIVRSRGWPVQVLAGAAAVASMAALPEVDVVMAAISGAAGLPACMAAAQQGKRILLANKEALVLGAQVFLDAVQAAGAQLLPVDSEHSAIFQALPIVATRTNTCPYVESTSAWAKTIDRLILTASGGPFLQRDPTSLSQVTSEEACAHPNWVMGRKISVDSATMMNKVLEVIEAHYLFGIPAHKISVVIHPQSIVHSMVEYCDASIVAQLGAADMRTPIAVALAWPRRIESAAERLNFKRLQTLTFIEPDVEQFPALPLAWQALQGPPGAAAVLNAANEVAVEQFLLKRLAFDAIARVNAYTLERMQWPAPAHLNDLLALDQAARHFTQHEALSHVS